MTSSSPITEVAVIVEDARGRTLLVDPLVEHGGWSIPSGPVGRESIDGAAVRVAREALDVHARRVSDPGIVLETGLDGSGDHRLVHVRIVRMEHSWRPEDPTDATGRPTPGLWLSPRRLRRALSDNSTPIMSRAWDVLSTTRARRGGRRPAPSAAHGVWCAAAAVTTMVAALVLLGIGALAAVPPAACLVPLAAAVASAAMALVTAPRPRDPAFPAILDAQPGWDDVLELTDPLVDPAPPASPSPPAIPPVRAELPSVTAGWPIAAACCALALVALRRSRAR